MIIRLFYIHRIPKTGPSPIKRDVCDDKVAREEDFSNRGTTPKPPQSYQHHATRTDKRSGRALMRFDEQIKTSDTLYKSFVSMTFRYNFRLQNI